MSKKFMPIVILMVLFLSWMCSRHSPLPPPLPPELPNLSKVVIGYYPTWKKNAFDHTKIKYEYLTHIAHAFTKPDAQGNLVIPDDYVYPALVREAHRQNVKVIMSLGGWGNCEGFPGMAATPETRSRLINQVLNFLKTHSYDGVDIDWEFISNPVEQQNFVSFIKEISSALKAQNPPLLLSMAAPSGHYWARWINYEELVNSFDYIGCMTYDYHGEWSDHSGHNSPLYSCANDACGSFNDSYLYCISRSIPGEKLLLGLPFFGRSFDCSGLHQKSQKSLYYGYNEVMDLLNSGWTYLWDDCSQAPYVQKPDKTMIVSFDDEKSIGLKCQYVVEKKAAGVIIWEITQDDYKGSSALLKVVGKTYKQEQQ